LAFVAIVLATVASGDRHAFAETVMATPDTLRDFMIQNVCLDAAGSVLTEASPIDGNPACVAQRDLHPGERLPYHKHDHPSPSQLAAAPTGYQRHDSFPVETAGFGVVVEHSFDFGSGPGRRFDVFDRGSDGGDIAILSPGAISFGATEDGGTGFALWVGECRGPLTTAALSQSWIIAQFDPQHPGLLAGETVARLNGLPAGQAACPNRFNAAFTRWRVAPFSYRAAPGQGAPFTLTTLVSEHYSGANPATAGAVERFYFSRELGGTRWEAWRHAGGNARFSAARVVEQAAWFASTGRCSAAETPAGGAPLVLIDCREWTRIAPSADRAGDRPGFFIDAIRTRPDAPPFFAPPPAPN
jgi:hypothetical protein